MSRQVLPTAPSPTTTHLIVCIAVLFQGTLLSFKIWPGEETEGGGDVTTNNQHSIAF